MPNLATSIPGVDLLDLDRFQRLEHHEMFRRLRQEAPVSWHEHPRGRGFWSVVQYSDLVAVNRDTDRYSSEAGGISLLDGQELRPGSLDSRGLMMLTMDPPKHRDHRGLLMRLLTPARLRENEDAMAALADREIDKFVDSGRCDIIADFANPFTFFIIADLLGVPEEDQEQIRQQFQGRKGTVGSTSKTMTHSPLQYLYDTLSTYVEDRRREPHLGPAPADGARCRRQGHPHRPVQSGAHPQGFPARRPAGSLRRPARAHAGDHH